MWFYEFLYTSYLILFIIYVWENFELWTVLKISIKKNDWQLLSVVKNESVILF